MIAAVVVRFGSTDGAVGSGSRRGRDHRRHRGNRTRRRGHRRRRARRASAGIAEGQIAALPDLTGIIKNQSWAQAAGKALFWDQHGRQRHRRLRHLSFPGRRRPAHHQPVEPRPAAGGKTVFGASNGSGLMGVGSGRRTEHHAQAQDFPFRKLSDPNNANSTVLFDSNDVSSSQGTFAGDFVSTKKQPKQTASGDQHRQVRRAGPPRVFNVDGHGVRKVEPRNSPTAINAVFNHRNFWDGRANNVFNGAGVFGLRDIKKNPSARLVVKQPDGTLKLQALELEERQRRVAGGRPAAQRVRDVLRRPHLRRCRPQAAGPAGAASSRPSMCEDSVFGRKGPDRRHGRPLPGSA